MKKLLFSIISVGIWFSNVNAQYSAGSLSVGGSFMLWFQNPKTETSNQTIDGTKTTDFTILPSVEYFFADDLSVGAGIGYDLNRQKTVNGTTTTTNKTGIFYFEPFVRKYFKMGDRFCFFGQGGFTWGTGNFTSEVSNSNTNTTVSTKYARSSFSIGISPGISFSVSDKVTLESSFGFLGYMGTSNETGTNQKDKTSNFGIQLNPSTIALGIRIFLK